MSAKRPTNITVKRLVGDDYAEKFSVKPMPASITSASLVVEGLGSVGTTIDTVAETIETVAIPTGIADAAPGSYDYELVITTGGTTRTVVEGTWVIIARAVVP